LIGARKRTTFAIVDRSVNEFNFSRPGAGRAGVHTMTQATAPLLQHRDAAVLTLTLNRPQALNSFTGEMHDTLMAALKTAASDAGVRCVVLTGAGRAFCAGQDLSDPAIAPDPSPGAAPKDIGGLIESRYRPLALMLHDFPVPVVAAVNGVAAGAGANLALNCDFVLAARSATFIQAFSKIGLIPDCGGTWLLPRLVGRAHAIALAMLGDKLPAEEAQRIGLIFRCVDDGALGAEVSALARRLAAMPMRALAETRRAFAQADHQTLSAALRMEADVQRRLGAGADYLEGVSAFFAKRAPVFKDR
jgi:2-(1,2-epoxy-1,2-dihydrophenyl)acetyl-CoA isomerase